MHIMLCMPVMIDQVKDAMNQSVEIPRDVPGFGSVKALAYLLGSESSLRCIG